MQINAIPMQMDGRKLPLQGSNFTVYLPGALMIETNPSGSDTPPPYRFRPTSPDLYAKPIDKDVIGRGCFLFSKEPGEGNFGVTVYKEERELTRAGFHARFVGRPAPESMRIGVPYRERSITEEQRWLIINEVGHGGDGDDPDNSIAHKTTSLISMYLLNTGEWAELDPLSDSRLNVGHDTELPALDVALLMLSGGVYRGCVKDGKWYVALSESWERARRERDAILKERKRDRIAG